MPQNSLPGSPSPGRSISNTTPQLPGSAGFFFLMTLLVFLLAGGCRSLTESSGWDFHFSDWIPDWTAQSWFNGSSDDPRYSMGYEPDYVHWFDHFVFVRGSRGQVLRLQRMGDAPPMMLAQDNGAEKIYKVRKEDQQFFRKNGFAILSGGPFLWVDPGLKARKRSRQFRDWMNGYKDNEILERILNHLARQHPTLAQRVRIGTSVQDRPIYALRISRNYSPAKKSLMFNSGHHGMEVLSIDYSLDVACLLLNESCYPHSIYMPTDLRDYILNNFVVWIIPMVNPDGLHRFWNHSGYMGRKNANGVDLNRNYPFYWKSWNNLASSGSAASYKYRGPEPGSEPETRAMMDLARKHRFLMSFSFHTYATRVLFPYTADGASNPYPDPAKYFASTIARHGISYRTTRQYEAARKLYSVDGTDQDWLYHELGTMALIVEGSMSTPSWENALKSIAGMRPVSLASLENLKSGPRLELEITDPSGRPLPEARLVLNSRTWFEQENWPRADQNGKIHVFLVPDETLYAEIQAPGYRSRSFRMQCNKVCVQRFQLTPTR
ncbi:MAG TPA: hypothetical protein DEA96_00970 [Leptospiraceae bacterium]|nr:hypothetical protein [Spirochaetaceae bacterium]HBS03504.1 hypothetical protein [Leptospiraceae bacterium]|tara:strand:+ start:30356 stop:32005 length:1650 start_codon:yes stop_codon:yes gene_type:complete